jgi:hypothetical protein
LADISKINAVALANIAKLDAVLAANLAKVNGLVFASAPGFVGLLDTYTGAAAGYSTRRLASSATNLMRIREDSGDTETDIGYDSNGDLDTAAIATHCGTANGFVVSWVDQSGNANDADQSTLASQPQIYNGTAVITENGKPALDTLTFGKFTITQLDVVSAFYVARTATLNYADFVLADATSGFTMPGFNSTFGQIGFYDGSNSVFGTNYQNDLNQHLVSAVATASATVHVDGVSEASGTSSSVSVDALFDGRSAGNINFEGKAQEIVLWTTDQSTNRTGIEGNQNAHFQIGNFGTPTSGLLATYTGAAAAYSVRQLANTAALSMRVREDATDTETNIGFDANGDLDTAAIAAHCGTANGYVVNWYDQAGSQNDATQSTSGDQPQIYNGTAVITDNGKPCVEFDGANDFLDTSFIWTDYADSSYFAVLQNVGATLNADKRIVAFGNTSTNTPMWAPIQTSNTTSTCSYLRGDTVGAQVFQANSSSAGFGLMSVHIDSSGYDSYKNGGNNISINVSWGTYTLNTFALGAVVRTAPIAFYDGKLQEVIVFDNNKESNRTAIETDINTYYDIY